MTTPRERQKQRRLNAVNRNMEAQQTIPCMTNEPPHMSFTNANSDASSDEDLSSFRTKQENSKYEATTDSKEVYLKACLDMAASPVSQIVRSLDQSDLSLGSYGLGAKRLQPLLQSLKVNETLVSLDLSDNCLEGCSLEQLIATMEKNGSIHTINISRNKFSTDSALSLSRFLTNKDCPLRTLIMSNVQLGDKSGGHIAKALANNNRLESLDLSGNDLSTRTASALAKSLKRKSSLTSLNLSWNVIHREALKQLCQSLKLNNTLRDLNLSWNGLNHEDLIQIVEMLKQNQGITQIALCGNRINDDGVLAIAEGVKMSSSLMSIDLSHNDFTDVSASALLNSIELNDGIIALKLSWTRVSLEVQESIESMIKGR